MTTPWQPFHEPLRRTLLRTGAIAVIGGAVLSRWWGGWAQWPLATLAVLWFSFGGHLVEVFYLNWLRTRLSPSRAAQTAARVATWFFGGMVLALGASLTMLVTTGRPLVSWTRWWIFGAGFVALEMLVHLVPLLRGQPGFYRGGGAPPPTLPAG